MMRGELFLYGCDDILVDCHDGAWKGCAVLQLPDFALFCSARQLGRIRDAIDAYLAAEAHGSTGQAPDRRDPPGESPR